jgi:cellulose synthase/poly-beta-1,6-N-acetylglucosamine synthase-like glycosyltransferase
VALVTSCGRLLRRIGRSLISVLIPAHNEAGVLRECLDAVRAQTLPVDEIIVVADSCTDQTAAVAESYGAVVVETEQGGKAASQNVGLPYVTGDILVCIDADTIIDVDVVERLVGDLQAGADATCANMLPMPHQKGFWVANRRFAYALGRYWWRWCQAQMGRLMVLSGCAYALRTETVRSIGGFPGQLITCDMDLTWNLYEAGYKSTFCHQALAYTYDPETFSVYTKQMRRWASGFFQNFQTHYGQVLRSPSALLVVGSLLFDLLMMPVTYTLVLIWTVHDPARLRWLAPSIAIHAAITTFIASRTITWKQALVGFPCYWIANWWNKAIYFWTFVREWILGRHYTSWTGRQGRATEITPMSRSRKIGLISTAIGLALAVAGWHTATAPSSLAQMTLLLLGIASVGAFGLSFLCLERPLTLVLFLSIATISGLVLNSVPQEGVPHWRDVWSLELLGLTFGVVGFVLTYLREEGELGAGTAADAVF